VVVRHRAAWPRPRPCYACLALFLVGFIALAYILCSAAHAQDVIDLHEYRTKQSGTAKPDPYRGIFSKKGTNCCNGRDCRRVLSENDFIIKLSGGYELKETREFIPENDTGISPDQHWHICRYPADAGPNDRHNGKAEIKPGGVRCLLIPAGGV